MKSFQKIKITRQVWPDRPGTNGSWGRRLWDSSNSMCSLLWLLGCPGKVDCQFSRPLQSRRVSQGTNASEKSPSSLLLVALKKKIHALPVAGSLGWISGVLKTVDWHCQFLSTLSFLLWRREFLEVFTADFTHQFFFLISHQNSSHNELPKEHCSGMWLFGSAYKLWPLASYWTSLYLSIRLRTGHVDNTWLIGGSWPYKMN